MNKIILTKFVFIHILSHLLWIVERMKPALYCLPDIQGPMVTLAFSFAFH